MHDASGVHHTSAGLHGLTEKPTARGLGSAMPGLSAGEIEEFKAEGAIYLRGLIPTDVLVIYYPSSPRSITSCTASSLLQVPSSEE